MKTNTDGSDMSPKKVDECLCWKKIAPIFSFLKIFHNILIRFFFLNVILKTWNMAIKTYHINISVTKKVNDCTNLCLTKNILRKNCNILYLRHIKKYPRVISRYVEKEDAVFGGSCCTERNQFLWHRERLKDNQCCVV